VKDLYYIIIYLFKCFVVFDLIGFLVLVFGFVLFFVWGWILFGFGFWVGLVGFLFGLFFMSRWNWLFSYTFNILSVSF